MSDVGTLEYLGTPERERRRLPRVAWVALAVVAAVGAGCWIWSDHARSEATIALSTAYGRAVQEAGRGETQVQVLVAYITPTVWAPDLPDDTRAGLWDLVERQATSSADELAAVRRAVANIRVLPWQGEQTAAQAALLELIDAQAARFAEIAADGSRVDRILADGPIPTGAAEKALRAAGAETLPVR